MTSLAPSAHWGDPERIAAVQPNIHNPALVTSWVLRWRAHTVRHWGHSIHGEAQGFRSEEFSQRAARKSRPIVNRPLDAGSAEADVRAMRQLRRHRRIIRKPTSHPRNGFKNDRRCSRAPERLPFKATNSSTRETGGLRQVPLVIQRI